MRNACKILLLIVLSLACSCGCQLQRDGQSTIPPKVTMYERPPAGAIKTIRILAVLAQNKKYANTWVYLECMVSQENNGYALYFSHEDYEYGIRENAVWVGSMKDALRERIVFRSPYSFSDFFSCNGFLDFENRGPGGEYAATIWEADK